MEKKESSLTEERKDDEVVDCSECVNEDDCFICKYIDEDD